MVHIVTIRVQSSETDGQIDYEHGPRKLTANLAYSRSTSPEIPRFSGIEKSTACFCKLPPADSILNHLKPVHSFIFYFSTTHVTITSATLTWSAQHTGNGYYVTQLLSVVLRLTQTVCWTEKQTIRPLSYRPWERRLWQNKLSLLYNGPWRPRGGVEI